MCRVTGLRVTRFLTRMFDALSLTFPDGERYFIQSVRLFRDQIQDPDLKQRVADFIRQEAQHGIAHDKMNQVMKDQGMPVDQFIQRLNKVFKFELKYRSPQYNIAMTAAAEHLTALMAETFYGEKETLQDAHPYVRALFAWHAIEEMEHRDVAFDVMQQVGNVPEVDPKNGVGADHRFNVRIYPVPRQCHAEMRWVLIAPSALK